AELGFAMETCHGAVEQRAIEKSGVKRFGAVVGGQRAQEISVGVEPLHLHHVAEARGLKDGGEQIFGAVADTEVSEAGAGGVALKEMLESEHGVKRLGFAAEHAFAQIAAPAKRERAGDTGEHEQGGEGGTEREPAVPVD